MPAVVLGVALSTDQDSATPKWLLPIPRFRVSRSLLGHVHASPDQDGVVRSMVLRRSNGQDRYWALALQAVRLAEGTDSIVESAVNNPKK